MNFNMFNDFRFIFPQGIERYKNVNANSVKFTPLIVNYCMCDYRKQSPTHSGEVVNLITLLESEYAGYHHGKVVFNSGENKKDVNQNLLELIKRDIHKKMSLFSRARHYHNNMVRCYKDTGNLCFSLFASALPGEPVPEHMKTLKKLSTHFFNNIRSLTTFKHHVLGYFWVTLKNSSDDRPYLHVNFYIDTKDFNHVICNEVNQCWLNALSTMQSRPGGVLHLTRNDNYQNGLMSVVTESYKHNNDANHYVITMQNIRGDVLHRDLNSADSEELKSLINFNDNSFFMHYLYELAKESYFILKGSRSFGSSSVKKMLR